MKFESNKSFKLIYASVFLFNLHDLLSQNINICLANNQLILTTFVFRIFLNNTMLDL